MGLGEQRARTGFTKYEDIDRPVKEGEMTQLRRHARQVGLWRMEDMVPLDKPLVDL